MVSIKERYNNYKRQFITAKKRKEAYKLQEYNIVNAPFETIDAIIISGQPRGGTTWLAETMMTHPTTGIIWEPLHPKLMAKFDRTRELGSELGNFPFIPEAAKNEDLEEWMSDVLSAKFIPYEYISWPPGANNNLLEKKQWIVKFCRANRMLPWMVEHLDIRPPIFLLRHPCAVVSSQLRHEAFDYMGSTYEKDNGPYDELYKKYEHILKSVNSEVGKLAAWWAMDNVLPLTHDYNNKKWVTVTYEELVSTPKQGFSRIYNGINMEMPQNLITDLDRPSSTTKPGAMVLHGGNQLEGWTKKLKADEIDEILDIVHAFGIDIYTKELEPDYSKLYF